ncbi:MAG: response regulator, partial [Deltaproteobacteria bacterium]|nr:response regulator [Deltaproteobacteria bacterium]
EFVTFLAKLLRRRGYEVTVAHSGESALELARREEFAVVLLDVKMGGMDGIQVLGELRRLAPRTAVIMLTGHVSRAERQDGLACGAFAYLLKPHPIPDLLAQIEAAARSGGTASNGEAG